MKNNNAKQKFMAILLIVCMLFTMVPTAVFAAEYNDTNGHWAQSAIDRWSGYGVINGYGDNTFKPDSALTRAETATILSNTLGLVETADNPFSDVKKTDWFAGPILRCYAEGIISGSNGMANPNQTITRQEAMCMLANALDIAGADVSKIASYSDRDSVADWAAPQMAALVSKGIVGGVGDNRLAPDSDMSRAALMSILDRSIVQYIQSSGTHTLTDKTGIVLVAAGDVTLTGETKANILVTSAAEGKTIHFNKAVVNGTITVQNDNVTITAANSTLPEIVGGEVKKPAAVIGGGGSSSSGNGGSTTPTYSDLSIKNDGEVVENATYQDVTIEAAVGDGDVTLKNMNILGDLTISGGGSNTVNLINCTIGGKIIINKVSGEAPRLELTATQVKEVVAEQPAIIEATDTTSIITKVLAEASVTVDSDVVKMIEVPATAKNVIVDAKGNAAFEFINNALGTKIIADDATKITYSGEKKDDVVIHIHVWDAGVETQAPNCTAEGVKTFTCTAATCPIGTRVENIAKTDHTPAVDEAVPADCEGPGYTEGSHCSVCNTVIVAQEEIPALGHDFVSEKSVWISVGDQYHNKTCGRCGAKGDLKSSHVYDENVTCEMAAVCTVCSHEKAYGEHTYGLWEVVKEATCTESGENKRICSSCGVVENSSITALGHAYADEFTVDKAATCGENGSKSKHCTRCGSKTEVTVIPATGQHNYSTWTKADDTNHTAICSVCSDVKTEVHSWDAGVVTTEPTATETGVKTFTCSVCNDTKTEVIFAQETGELWIEISTFGTKTYAALKWTAKPDYEGKYFVNGDTYGVANTTTSRNIHTDIKRAESNTLSYIVKIEDENGNKTVWAEAKDIVTIYRQGVADVVVTGQADGKYLIEKDNFKGVYAYILKTADGNNIDAPVSPVNNGDYLLVAPYTGCKFEITEYEWDIAQSTYTKDTSNYAKAYSHLMVRVSDPKEFGFTPYNFTDEEQSADASNIEQLLNTGGKVKLTKDITLSSLAVTCGSNVVLDLNGKTLEADTMEISNGKTLKIIDSVESGRIQINSDSSFHITKYSSLTCDGGIYELNIYPNGRELLIINGTFSSDITDYIAEGSTYTYNEADKTYVVSKSNTN